MVTSLEFTELTLDTLAQAVEANKNTPCRVGNVVEISQDEADDVMITADLHGHRRNYKRIMRIADLENNPRRHLIMQEVCHGGPQYPSNGGCMSHNMLEDMAKMKAKYPERFHFILSNHELAEVTEYPILKAGKMLNLLFRLGISEMYGPATEEIREGYQKFIASCPLGVRLPGDIFICHSAPENVDQKGFDTTVLDRELTPDDLEEGSDVFQMLWGRDYRQENAEAFARLVEAQVLIHGHTPCEYGYHAPNDVQIILDCCGLPAAYVIIPCDMELTHGEILDRVQML